MATVTGRKKPAGFKVIPEGEQTLHVFDVKGIPRDNIKVVTMKMLNSDGLGYDKFPQKYDLDTDGGWWAFYNLLLHGYGVDLNEGDEFCIDELEDTYVNVEIVHKPSNNPDRPFANISKTLGPGEPFAVEGAASAGETEEDEDWD